VPLKSADQSEPQTRSVATNWIEVNASFLLKIVFAAIIMPGPAASAIPEIGILAVGMVSRRRR